MKKSLLVAAAIAAFAPLFVSAGAAQAATTFTPELVYTFDSTGDTDFRPNNIVSFGNKVAVELNNGDMWVSDGTSAGTLDMTSALATAGVQNVSIYNNRWNRAALDVDGNLYFFGSDGSTWDVYKTDGVTVTRVTTGLNAHWTIYYLGGKIYVWGNSGFSQVDPSTGAVVSIENNNDCSDDDNTHVQLVGGLILFVYDNNNCNEELYTWDPANPLASTVEITASAGALGYDPSDTDYMDGSEESWFLFNNEVYFTANGNDGTNDIGYELFKTDGTQAGTVLVKDINTNASDSSYAPNDSYVAPTVYNNELYFGAYNGTTGTVWKTDGTTVGTVEVIANPDQGGDDIESAAVIVNGKMFMDFNSSADGTEYFVTDGTEAGTTMLKDINVGSSGSVCYGYCVTPVLFAGQAFFVADDGTTNAVWTTDGTPEGTVMVSNTQYEYAIGNQDEASLVVAGDNLFYGVSDETSGEMALYKVSAPSSALPNTGADLRTVAFSALGAMALVAFGGALVIARRRNAQV